MLLLDFSKASGNPWVSTSWQLTYKVSWTQFCKAIDAIKQFYDHLEVFRDNSPISISLTEKVDIPEASTLTIRGMSKILNVPVMITFANQAQTVGVYFSTDKPNEEIDYKFVNYTLGQYLDSIELAMHRQ